MKNNTHKIKKIKIILQNKNIVKLDLIYIMINRINKLLIIKKIRIY